MRHYYSAPPTELPLLEPATLGLLAIFLVVATGFLVYR